MVLDLLGKCIGEEAKCEGIKLLFDGLQQPVLNKQVSKVGINYCEIHHTIDDNSGIFLPLLIADIHLA